MSGLLQDRLIEPANDNAKYYYLTLKGLDPGNAALSSLMQDLGTRLASKARRALILGQVDAAKIWLDEAGAIGFTSAEVSSAQHDLDAALAKQNFMTNFGPRQPTHAVEVGTARLSFHGSRQEAGRLGRCRVHRVGSWKSEGRCGTRGPATPGVFEDAALKAVSKWRYQRFCAMPDLRRCRTQIRIRFTLS